MGVGVSSNRRRLHQHVNTNPSSSTSSGCAALCCACFGSAADWDLEFYVHGIDFLPDYEKRRRRLSKLVRGGHLWSWSTSYMCFVSAANLDKPNVTEGSSRTASRRSSRFGLQATSSDYIID